MVIDWSYVHPQYTMVLQDWDQMRDCYKGERQIKSKGTQYLPATANQISDGFNVLTQAGSQMSKGRSDYEAYRLRARYHNYVRESVQLAIGMMHSQPPKIELPSALQGISSSEGETLEQLLVRINTEQLITGRVGLFLDMPTQLQNGEVPYIATYAAERIINWDNGAIQQLIPQKLNLVVLDEKELVRQDDFSWAEVAKHRVLFLGDLDSNQEIGTYRQNTFTSDSEHVGEPITPIFRGRTLKQIPFIIVNSCDLVPEPDEPPLLDLANLTLTIYRGEADYRQNLFMQGQDTLVLIGSDKDEDDTIRTGAGSRIDLPAQPGADAKYVGVTSDGLEEQRNSLENDRQLAGSMGAQTADSTSRERESGRSLHIRVAARTADLNQIAETGARGLQDLLKIAAEWVGANPEEVSVTPNKEFADEPLTGQSMVEQQTARNLGYPISAKSLHQVAFDRGLTKLTFEEEEAQAKSEKETEFKREETGDRNAGQKPTGETNGDDNG